MTPEQEFRRLRWRCRRGMRELDVLLMSFVDSRYRTAEPELQVAFQRLLSLSDPQILALLNGQSTAEDVHLGKVVELLLAQWVSADRQHPP